MPGRAKCGPGCDCEKHSRPRMSPEQEKARQRERSKAYYEANRELVSERAKQKRADPVAGEKARERDRESKANLSPEKREKVRRDARERYRKNPRSREEISRAHLHTRYRLTPDDRQQMIDEQGSCCYLCGDPLDLAQWRKVHVDHDHRCCPRGTTCGNCIRGIACDPCNRGAGYFREDPNRLRRVADALEAAQARVRLRIEPT